MITRYEDIAREESIVDEKDKVAAENIVEYLKDNYKDSFRQPAIGRGSARQVIVKR